MQMSSRLGSSISFEYKTSEKVWNNRIMPKIFRSKDGLCPKHIPKHMTDGQLGKCCPDGPEESFDAAVCMQIRYCNWNDSRSVCRDSKIAQHTRDREEQFQLEGCTVQQQRECLVRYR